VLALGYHGISAEWPESLAVTPAGLESNVAYLLSRGWTGTTFTHAVASQAKKQLAVTFDDACRSVLELAYPILQRLGVPGTVFVPTAYADTGALMQFGTLGRWIGTRWEEELRCMNWRELTILLDAGWEIGSHTETHPHLGQLDQAKLARELQESKMRCEHELGVPCTSLAYPFSDVTPRVWRAAEEAGYEAAATVEAGLRRPLGGSYEWPRVGIYRNDGPLRFRLKTAPMARRARRLVSELRSG
jgi:peptidoglycan/xylan/chitin deacetylase (PgdA/CDA1 family)